MKQITLQTKLSDSFRIGEKQKKALGRLGIETVKDLLYYFPVKYSKVTQVKNISGLQAGEEVTLYGTLSGLKTRKTFRGRVPVSEAKLKDLSGEKIKVMWFHQPFIAKMFQEDKLVKLTGKISDGKYGISIVNPEIEKIDEIPEEIENNLFKDKTDKTEIFGFPIYRETRGITSKWIYHTIRKIFQSDFLENLEDHIPEEILKKYNLPGLKTALVWLHSPKREKDAQSAEKRFAFEEIFLIQVRNQMYRDAYEANFSYKLHEDKKEMAKFINRFPFTPTAAQSKAITDILGDITSEKPMMRLIEGDVGSGKTFVAAVASHSVINNQPNGNEQGFGNLQVGYMAPTEVLAKQLFENFIKYFEGTGIQIGLITGKECRKFPSKVDHGEWTQISKNQLLKWVANGEIPIVIGTHTLIQKTVKFRDLALVIIDEQHRFGTNQRMKLTKKDDRVPHYLSMTATPIPRTLTLTIYGDLDLTIIDELPKDRKRVKTEIIEEKEREKAYKKIKVELKAGRQAYVICPRIEEADPAKENALNVKSVKEEAKRLKEKIFPNYKIDILHSRLNKTEKDKVMERFENGKTNILVSTSVIEVGVNIPNATVIIIEGAERFGLAQLHQLRGRVQRSDKQSYCFLFTDSENEKTVGRLEALEKTTNGFELSEMDLRLRGGGDLAGQKQWGLTDLAMRAIANIKLAEIARNEAKELLKNKKNLKKHKQLNKWLEDNDYTIHLE